MARGMKALVAVLLGLLLCRQPGRGQVQGEQEEEDEKAEPNYYDDDEEEEEDVMAGSRNTGLQCYSCQNLHRKEKCQEMDSCPHGHPFCKTLIAQGNTESGPLTTYSAWCADTCNPITRMADGTLMTMTCCQTTLCNLPPWQTRQSGMAQGSRGSPQIVATALLFGLLPSLGSVGS